MATKQEEVDRNFVAFQAMLPELLKDHPGKYALLKEEVVIEFFDTVGDAVIFGQKEYPDGLYSVQRVVDEVVDLGYFSHAMSVTSV